MKPLDTAARSSASELDAHLTENVSVPMRDGVRLVTDVYRPARAGRPLADRRPVLLHRTPYKKVETEPPPVSAASLPPAATWWRTRTAAAASARKAT